MTKAQFLCSLFPSLAVTCLFRVWQLQFAFRSLGLGCRKAREGQLAGLATVLLRLGDGGCGHIRACSDGGRWCRMSAVRK